MSGFDEARRLKNEELARKSADEKAASDDRYARLQDIRRQCTLHFKSHQQDVGTRLEGDTLTIHRGNQDYIDVAALNGGKYKAKVGGVDVRFVGYDIVRNGKTVEGEAIYRTILDWFDGDLAG